MHQLDAWRAGLRSVWLSSGSELSKFRVLGFRVYGFRVLGFLGVFRSFRVFGFRVETGRSRVVGGGLATVPVQDP